MPVALLTSPGWRGAVSEKRRFCRHSSPGGLEKAREGFSYIEDWLFSTTRGEAHEGMVTSF